MSEERESKDALKATGTVGGGQIVNILIGLVKTKAVAIILGPAGVGVVGLLTTMTEMIRNISSFGLTFSGVRDISIAESKNDDKEIAKIVKVFNRWVLIAASLGAFIAVVLCFPLSRYLFNNDSFAFGIAFLSISIFFTALGSGYGAVMQGKRAIPLMVKASIISNLIAAVLTVIVYLLYLDDGIIPSMIIAALVSFAVNYFFYKKLNIPKFGQLSFSDSWNSAKGMIKIGIFTIIVSVFDQIMSLGLRAFISEKADVDGVGLFTAANTIATLYLSIVLNSMASDYYPRLASINEDNTLLQKSVNSQLYITLLLASPIIVGMVGFGDIVIGLLYSNKFAGAVDILKWQILGDFFKIISWPCGFIFLAKGMGKFYTGYSIFFTLLYVGIIYFAWDYYGFSIIGISFFIGQLLAVLFTYVYSFFKFGIYVNSNNFKVIVFFSIALLLAYYSHEYYENTVKIIISGLTLLASVLFSIYHLNSIVDVMGFLRRTLRRK